MALEIEFAPLSVEELPALAAEKKAEGARFVQLLAVNTEEGIDLVYTFMKGDVLTNHEIKGVGPDTTVPSITDQFLAAFVFENEAHDLFGVDVQNIAIDFEGSFYTLSQSEPMTVISPAQKAAREKKRAAAAAKAAKEARAHLADATAESTEELEERLASMDPTKAAKVRAAMERKAAADIAAKKKKRAEKIASLDPDKAAKLKAALEAKKAREAAAAAAAGEPGETPAAADAPVEEADGAKGGE